MSGSGYSVSGGPSVPSADQSLAELVRWVRILVVVNVVAVMLLAGLYL